MSIRPLIVDWNGLKKMGWPYSRVHTRRLMQKEIIVSHVVDRESGKREYRIIPNPLPFPAAAQLGSFPNSPFVWRVTDVLSYFEANGLSVKEDWYAPA